MIGPSETVGHKDVSLQSPANLMICPALIDYVCKVMCNHCTCTPVNISCFSASLLILVFNSDAGRTAWLASAQTGRRRQSKLQLD